MIEFIKQQLLSYGINGEFSPYLVSTIAVIFIALLCAISNWIAKKFILGSIIMYARKSKNKWDDIMVEKRVFERLSHLVPAVIVHSFAPVFPTAQVWIERLSFSYMIIVGMLVLSALLNTIDEIYRTYSISRIRPIKGYLQVVNIIVYILGAIIIIGVLIDRSPWLLISGIGALSAVLSLVFKDSLLGLVAGVQLVSNNMIKIGDWIEMPSHGVDGEVIEMTLTTVKVRNWDKTIITVPAYSLISDSFKNWRGMHESGGRRIKRALYIDMTSIKFCTEEMLDRFEKFELITEYIRRKREEIKKYNEERHVDVSQIVNGRRLTNIGTFRAYVTEYIKNHPGIHHGMIEMVRHLPPTEHGLPIEIYAFTNDTAWVKYEAIQADIFDHILAVLPQFELRIFQNPSGHDIKESVEKLQFNQ